MGSIDLLRSKAEKPPMLLPFTAVTVRGQGRAGEKIADVLQLAHPRH